MKLFVKSDIEGFFAFGMDAMLAFLLLGSLLIGFLGFPAELVFTRILPAASVGLIVGNGFYAYQAMKLSRLEGRDDICAMPYGISTLTMIVYVFLVMFPTQQKLIGSGMEKEAADIIAWHTGILACICTGLIEFFGAFFVHHLRKVVPSVVMLVAIAGTGLMFLSMDYVLRVFAHPLVGMTSLALICVFYFGGVKSKWGVPAGVFILAFGTTLAWVLHYLDITHLVPGSVINKEFIGLHIPTVEAFNILPSLPYIVEFLPIIIPIGFIFLIGSLQNIEAAAAAGDNYNARPLLLVNGVGSLATAFMGSPFPTSIFLGHPGYKAIGARAGYSLINGIVWTVICFTGTLSLLTFLIPIEAVMAFIIWIGVVVCSHNFQHAKSKHIPAVVIGLIPAFAAYTSLVVKHTLAVTGDIADQSFFNSNIEALFVSSRGFYLEGLFALGQGYIFTCMIFAAIIYYIIEQRFRVSALWCLVGAFLTAAGFIHNYIYTSSDIIGEFTLPSLQWTKWSMGYIAMAITLLVVPVFQSEDSKIQKEPE